MPPQGGTFGTPRERLLVAQGAGQLRGLVAQAPALSGVGSLTIALSHSTNPPFPYTKIRPHLVHTSGTFVFFWKQDRF